MEGMSDEHWATLSVYDHRTALYRRALILFDRIVVPVTTTPFEGISETERDMLAAEVSYLAANDAAVQFDWDPAVFETWQQSVTSPTLARALNNDPLYASRLQLSEQYVPLIPAGVSSVTAVPAYHDPHSFEATTNELRNEVMEAALLQIVLPRLPVPDEGTDLATILAFRNREVFRDSIYHLHKWQKQILPELLNDPDHRNLRAAAADFDRWILQYSQAIEDAHFAKVKTAVTSVLAVGAVLCPFTSHLVTALSALASPLFSMRELRKPNWKIVSEKECAPAAIVYECARL